MKELLPATPPLVAQVLDLRACLDALFPSTGRNTIDPNRHCHPHRDPGYAAMILPA